MHDDFFTSLTANPELSSFAQAFQTGGFEQQLAMDMDGEWTVFAPADTVVFDATAFDTDGALSAYIVEGAYSYDDLVQLAEEGDGTATLTTIDGQEITVELVDDVLMVAGVAQITEQDIEVANGYIHVIDSLIQPTMAPAVGG
ncbi:MAG: fasciclin domain-containing protein [Trueperaceae bacterium]|nr:fasciclin domain-containing protein [Trueperaceae bacterium]